MGGKTKTDQITGGATVEVTKEQRFPDGTVIAAGERGEVLHHSSQAACWVIQFADRDGMMKVVAGVFLKPVAD